MLSKPHKQMSKELVAALREVVPEDQVEVVDRLDKFFTELRHEDYNISKPPEPPKAETFWLEQQLKAKDIEIASLNKAVADKQGQVDDIIAEAVKKMDQVEQDATMQVDKFKADLKEMFSAWRMLNIQHPIKLYCGEGLEGRFNSSSNLHLMKQIVKSLMAFISQHTMFEYTHIGDYMVAWNTELYETAKLPLDPSQIKAIMGLILTKEQFKKLAHPRPYKEYFKLSKLQASISNSLAQQCP